MFIAIVPAHNEERTIDSVIRNLGAYVDRVVVVDDGSTDNTAKVGVAAGAVVLSHWINRGQGAALETGHAYARSQGADAVVHFDADGQFEAADIPGALSTMLENNADIVFGSRFLDHRSELPWSKRNILLPAARIVNQIITGLSLTDAHNGFRLLNRRALYAVALSHDRMAHASEIPLLVKRHGLRYIEYPVKVVYREYGQAVAGGFQILKDLVLGKLAK